jgi:hypothetical protein
VSRRLLAYFFRAGSTEAEADGTFGGRRVDDCSVLRDDDCSGGCEAAGGGAGGFHEALPVSADGFFASVESAYGFCGFRGADRFVFASERGAFREEREDGSFEGCVGGAGLVAAAGVATVLDDVPVLLVLFLPLDGTAAGLADLVLVRGGAFGFAFAFGHVGSAMVAGMSQAQSDMKLLYPAHVTPSALGRVDLPFRLLISESSHRITLSGAICRRHARNQGYYQQQYRHPGERQRVDRMYTIE